MDRDIPSLRTGSRSRCMPRLHIVAWPPVRPLRDTPMLLANSIYGGIMGNRRTGAAPARPSTEWSDRTLDQTVA